MSKIEIGLHEHHATYQASNSAPLPGAEQASQSSGSNTGQGLVDTPFAKVNSVVPDSPADDAGLKAGDRIRRFGNVNWINHEKLSKVAETVQRNQGVCPAPVDKARHSLIRGRRTLLSRSFEVEKSSHCSLPQEVIGVDEASWDVIYCLHDPRKAIWQA